MLYLRRCSIRSGGCWVGRLGTQRLRCGSHIRKRCGILHILVICFTLACSVPQEEGKDNQNGDGAEGEQSKQSRVASSVNRINLGTSKSIESLAQRCRWITSSSINGVTDGRGICRAGERATGISHDQRTTACRNNSDLPRVHTKRLGNKLLNRGGTRQAIHVKHHLKLTRLKWISNGWLWGENNR